MKPSRAAAHRRSRLMLGELKPAISWAAIFLGAERRKPTRQHRASARTQETCIFVGSLEPRGNTREANLAQDADRLAHARTRTAKTALPLTAAAANLCLKTQPGHPFQ